MQYLCLLYVSDEEAVVPPDAASPETVSRDLMAEGHDLVSAGLAPPRAARTLRLRGNGMTGTDGPFAETREYLGGIFIIEAGDMAEAERLLARRPMRIVAAEIRPMKDITDPDWPGFLDRHYGQA